MPRSPKDVLRILSAGIVLVLGILGTVLLWDQRDPGWPASMGYLISWSLGCVLLALMVYLGNESPQLITAGTIVFGALTFFLALYGITAGTATMDLQIFLALVLVIGSITLRPFGRQRAARDDPAQP